MRILLRWQVTVLFVVALFVSSLSNAALVSRLNGQAVYDTDLNITWMADSTLAVSNTFGVSGIGLATGDMDWNTAQSWIEAMNAANYLGFNDWRLPTTVPDPACIDPNFKCTESEIWHLFEIEQAQTSDLFIIVSEYYWFGTECGVNCAYAYLVGQTQLTKDLNPHPASNVLSWAVRSGDVPIPAASWLFGSGLLGLVGIARRKKAA
jgi:hypothetical protein